MARLGICPALIRKHQGPSQQRARGKSLSHARPPLGRPVVTHVVSIDHGSVDRHVQMGRHLVVAPAIGIVPYSSLCFPPYG
jgi:hypothetical protein